MEPQLSPILEFLLNYSCPSPVPVPGPSPVPDDIYRLINLNKISILELLARRTGFRILPKWILVYSRATNTIVSGRIDIRGFPANRPSISLVGIFFSDDLQDNVGNAIGHSNILIINPQNRTFELFEPPGSRGLFFNAVSSFLGRSIGFRQIQGSFSFSGPQILYNEPVCNTLALIYAWARMNDPANLELSSEMSNLFEEQIERLVTNFHCFIYFEIQQLGFGLQFEMTSIRSNLYQELNRRGRYPEINKMNSDLRLTDPISAHQQLIDDMTTILQTYQ